MTNDKIVRELHKIARVLTGGLRDLRVQEVLQQSDKNIIKTITKLMRLGKCSAFSRGVKVELVWSISRGKMYPVILGEMSITNRTEEGLDILFIENDLIKKERFRQMFNLRGSDKLSVLLDVDTSAQGSISEKENLLEAADNLFKIYKDKEKILNRKENNASPDDYDDLDEQFDEIAEGRERLRNNLERSNLLTIWSKG